MKLKITGDTLQSAFDRSFPELREVTTTVISPNALRVYYHPEGLDQWHHMVTLDIYTAGYALPRVSIGPLSTTDVPELEKITTALGVCKQIMQWLYDNLADNSYYEEPTE